MSSIKEIPQEGFKPIFVCKRCGSNNVSPTSLGTHKFGAASIGFTQMDICTNCFNGSNLRF
jgi:transcription elongation factor Elf1